MPLTAAESQAGRNNTGCKCRARGAHKHWMPEGVQAAVEEETEVAASSQSAEGSMEHKKGCSRTAAACRQGLWGWLEADLLGWLLPHTRCSLAEAGG